MRQGDRRLCPRCRRRAGGTQRGDRKSTRLNSSHGYISYAVFCLKKKTNDYRPYLVGGRTPPELKPSYKLLNYGDTDAVPPRISTRSSCSYDHLMSRAKLRTVLPR